MISPAYIATPFRRFKKDFIAHIGQTAPGEPFYIYADQVEVDEKGQKIRYGLLDINIAFGDPSGKGKAHVLSIRTRWQKFRLYADGTVIEVKGNTDGELDFIITNRKDLQDFIFMFGGAIARFSINGFIRRFRWTGWNNFQALFRGDGTVIPDSTYNTEMPGPATNPADIYEQGSYPHYNSDGSPVDPSTHQQINISEWLAPQ